MDRILITRVSIHSNLPAAALLAEGGSGIFIDYNKENRKKQDGEALFLLFSSNIFAKQPEKAERKTNGLLDEGDFLWYAIIVIKYLFWQRKGG
ncbi:MAG TPA: hypothetical protein H9710_01510 [Candidatus Acutalibacter pullicola]|uniref:Uncharacterized protein n=1 Tax=Candidatus Acutalibacter pullicola TaxID=2838417 RepID=A0A9D2MTN5_9FIRM|nr:hypothetical protein [Candidatus Acutalibacter pullicola]